ncbi:carbohydrate ABC transporter membrane protein 2, CUT1 family [Micromonospora sediminicola]|uniref:Carbohydrate ABC transporter membrane protein 2, CUT1 family n=1 Tax=Micromonospora sediminicola TaxID=946078 RepID=A0A1A9B8A9_9ACTN|nr:carbohydrate ABC transporter permease [Micromonospora sediminicola]SBT65770.1 carbohydrate ABC transporter membrane protein 2, CUT1 family [Micromonospora sediminicola]
MKPRLLTHGVLLLGLAVMLYPVLWLVASSLRRGEDIFTSRGLWPDPATLDNYTTGWRGAGEVGFGRYLTNSLLVCAGAVVGNMIACSMAAYVFARLDFAFKKVLFAIMLATIMLPHHVTLVPQYGLFRALGWINTFLPLIVPKFLAVDAFFIFLMVQFIRSIPRELDEAAEVDGCGPIRIYWRVVLPLLTPALVTTAIFTFIWTYDDLFTQLIYLNDPARATVPIGLRTFLDATSSSNWGAMFAMSTVALLPAVVVFTFFQRRLVEGIAASGVKG